MKRSSRRNFRVYQRRLILNSEDQFYKAALSTSQYFQISIIQPKSRLDGGSGTLWQTSFPNPCRPSIMYIPINHTGLNSRRELHNHREGGKCNSVGGQLWGVGNTYIQSYKISSVFFLSSVPGWASADPTSVSVERVPWGCPIYKLKQLMPAGNYRERHRKSWFRVREQTSRD